jgi:hypothetical protein
LQLAVVIPVTLEASAANHREAAQQSCVLIPLAADAVQPTMLTAQFLRELAVAMPGALNLMKLSGQEPVLLANRPLR